MRAKAYPWAELRPDIALKWLELQRSNPALASPYFHPKFSRIIAKVRGDVELAVIGDHNGIAALFPFQRMPGDIGVPVGGHLSDFHGLVCASGFACDARALMKQCGLIAWDFDHLIASQDFLAPFHQETAPSPQIDLTRGFDAYYRETRSPKDDRAKIRRIERDLGPMRFVSHSTDTSALARLLMWKSQQYVRTGAPDIFADAKTRSIIAEIHESQDKHFSGMLSLLYAGDRLIAGHFGMRSDAIWHYWFPAYDAEVAAYSPGLVLLLKIAEHASTIGISTIDLGAGISDYKKRFMNASIQVASGSIELLSMRYVKRATRRHVRSMAAKMHIEGPALALVQAIRNLKPP